MSLVVLAACRQSVGGMPGGAESADVAITLEATETGNDGDAGPFVWRITLADSGGAPIEGAAVSLRGDMNHAGMMPVEATAIDQGGGVYLADFEWTMAGDWSVVVTAELPDGGRASRTFDFTVESSGAMHDDHP